MARGQVTVETALLIVFGVAGLIGMATYVQRAMQGNVLNSAQSYGSQFDPRDARSERQTVDLTETTTEQVGAPMVEARIIETTRYEPLRAIDGTIVLPAPTRHPQWVLESLPNGAVPREPAMSRASEVKSEWTAASTSTFEDRR